MTSLVYATLVDLGPLGIGDLAWLLDAPRAEVAAAIAELHRRSLIRRCGGCYRAR